MKKNLCTKIAQGKRRILPSGRFFLPSRKTPSGSIYHHVYTLGKTAIMYNVGGLFLYKKYVASAVGPGKNINSFY